MKKRVIIWGAGNYAALIARRCCYLNYDVAAFYDRNTEKQNRLIAGIKIITKEEFLELCRRDQEIMVVIGSERKQCAEEIKNDLMEFFPIDKPKTISLSDLRNEYLDKAKSESKLQGGYVVDFKSSIWPWLSNIMSEVDFWCDVSAEVMQGKTLRQHEDFLCRRVMDLVKPGDVVLDVGCGLFSQYGNKIGGGGIELRPIDPLSFFYKRINDRCSRKVDEIEFGMFELMSEFYKHRSADIVLIDNALDHCIDPYKSILECLQIVKPGGCLSLRHRCAEGVREYYYGLHNWNLDCEGSDFVIWNEKNYINVTDKLKDEVKTDLVLENYDEDHGDYISVNLYPGIRYDISHYTNILDNREYMSAIIENLMRLLAADKLNGIFQEWLNRDGMCEIRRLKC